MNLESKSPSPDLIIIYDGECPFCSAYVKMVRLRDSVGRVELIDARCGHPQVARARAQGFDLNEGMVAIYGGRFYHGDECINLLAMLTSESGFFNRLSAWAFRDPKRAQIAYPYLRCGRNLTLRMMGKRPISP